MANSIKNTRLFRGRGGGEIDATPLDAYINQYVQANSGTVYGYAVPSGAKLGRVMYASNDFWLSVTSSAIDNASGVTDGYAAVPNVSDFGIDSDYFFKNKCDSKKETCLDCWDEAIKLKLGI